MPRRLALPLLLLLTACSSGPLGLADFEECVGTYAVPAGTQRAVNAAAGQCRILFSESASAEARERAECLLPKLATTRSDQGSRAAFLVCPPPAPARAVERGPWEDYASTP